MASKRLLMMGLGVMALSLSAAGGGQFTQGTLNPMGQKGAPVGDQNGRGVESPTAQKELSDKQALARNDDRQKRLISDTEKLLILATQLHEDVGKTDKNVLSLNVVRRAQEIEKLAHDVKERMKG